MLFQKKLGDQILSAILEISFDIQPEELEETFLTPDCILIEMHIGKRGKTDMVWGNIKGNILVNCLGNTKQRNESKGKESTPASCFSCLLEKLVQNSFILKVLLEKSALLEIHSGHGRVDLLYLLPILPVFQSLKN